MTNVWRIGSDYGGKDTLPDFKYYKVVFAGEPPKNYNQVKKKDLIAITNGQKIVGVAQALNYCKLSEISQNLSNEYGDIQAIKVSPIFLEKDFNIDFGKYGGQGSQFHEAGDEYSDHIKTLFYQTLTKANYMEIKYLLSREKQLILQGPPGTGKTRKAIMLANRMLNSWKIEKEFEKEEKTGIDENGHVKILNGLYTRMVQFHPAYNYDDFVRGLVPQSDSKGNLVFKPENKILLQIANEAEQYKNGKYSDNPPPFILIIDEINRANLPAVLGELIYALEYRDAQVNCLYPDSFENDSKNSRKISLPSNLYIIGTMNTADRSVGTLDYAIRRRFVFEHLSPDPKNVLSGKSETLFDNVRQIFGTVEPSNNSNNLGPKWKMTKNNHLSGEFDYNDVMIGHSYFMADDENNLRNNLEYKIKPILWEYAKDGILIDNGDQKVVDEINKLIVS